MNGRCLWFVLLSLFAMVVLLVTLRGSTLLPWSIYKTCPTGSPETSHPATSNEKLRPVTFDQLTVDEMTFAIFGEPTNSSSTKSNAYLNYVRSHIAKPSPLKPRVPLNSRAVSMLYCRRRSSVNKIWSLLCDSNRKNVA